MREYDLVSVRETPNGELIVVLVDDSGTVMTVTVDNGFGDPLEFCELDFEE